MSVKACAKQELTAEFVLYQVYHDGFYYLQYIPE